MLWTSPSDKGLQRIRARGRGRPSPRGTWRQGLQHQDGSFKNVGFRPRRRETDLLAQERAGKRASPGAEAQQKGGSGWPPGSNKAATQTGSRTTGDRMGPCKSREEPGEAAGPPGCWGSRRPRAGRGCLSARGIPSEIDVSIYVRNNAPSCTFLKNATESCLLCNSLPATSVGKGFFCFPFTHLRIHLLFSEIASHPGPATTLCWFQRLGGTRAYLIIGNLPVGASSRWLTPNENRICV